MGNVYMKRSGAEYAMNTTPGSDSE